MKIMSILNIKGVFLNWMCFGCLIIIEYESGCKIMMCERCKIKFCFVCFKIVVDGDL